MYVLKTKPIKLYFPALLAVSVLMYQTYCSVTIIKYETNNDLLEGFL